MAAITRGDSEYVIVEGPTWVKAEANAKKLGGNLVTINDEAENTWLVERFYESGHTWVWIGLNDIQTEGSHEWSSGQTYSYKNWYGLWDDTNNKGFMKVRESYDYGLMGLRNADLIKGYWIDTNESYSFHGIAEIRLSTKPTYAISLSAYSINEGSTLTTTVSTTNVTAGTTLYYSLSGTGITSADFLSGSLLGSGVLSSSGSFSFSHALANDLTTEGTETLEIKLFSDSNRSNQVGSTASVSIRDTSTTPAPTYSLSTSTPVIGEGESFSTNVSTTNVAAGTSLFYSLSGNGITAADFTPGGLSGSGTVGADGKFSFSKTLANDLTTEGTETLTVRLFTDNNLSQQVGNAASVTVYDTSTTPAASINIGENNNGIANNGVLTNNGNINQFSNNGPVNTGTITSNSNNGNTTNSNNNSGNTFPTNSNNGNTVSSNNGNTTTVINNYYTIINSGINSNNQTTNTNSGNIGSTIGSYNTQNTINQTYVSKNSTDYKIVRIADNRYGIKLPDSNTVDEITGQRYVPFADKALDVQKDIKEVFDQVTGKETSDAKMFRLYNAAFARTPDADGLRYWINQFSAGTIDYKRVAQSFLSSNEFASKYGVANSNNDFVNNLYRNILGR